MVESASSSSELLLGVDVGTGSVRAALFTPLGAMVGHGAQSIETARPRPDYCEQSSEEIWKACGIAVRAALESATAEPGSVVGMSFDGTSSLVVLDADDRPVTVSPAGDDPWNIILWMDHRSLEETERINGTGHEVLRHVGGRISPEMAPPKLLWLKNHLPRSWRRAARCLELPDFLTYRATGIDVRSMCTTVCKWTYLGHETAPDGAGTGRWAPDFFAEIGLEDLFDGDRQGRDVRPMGTPIGGLTERAASELGLVPGIPVGVGILDAHAGGVGLLGAVLDDSGVVEESLERALALIGGTSSCHMAVSREPRFLEGVWGPYYSVMVPGMWLSEGGQTSTGSLIDHVIADSRGAAEAERRAREGGLTVYEVLNDEIQMLASTRGVAPGELTREFHLLPYFHGNRSPRADPSLRGVVSGLSLDESLESTALIYLAALQAIAHGTRHIIEVMNAGGFRIDSVLVCGGGTRNPIWLQEHADITGCRLHLPREPEAVLLGTAILGAVASGRHADIPAAMRAMGGSERVVEPDPRLRAHHDRKYSVFHRMYDHFQELRSMMEG